MGCAGQRAGQQRSGSQHVQPDDRKLGFTVSKFRGHGGARYGRLVDHLIRAMIFVDHFSRETMALFSMSVYSDLINLPAPNFGWLGSLISVFFARNGKEPSAEDHFFCGRSKVDHEL